jgi:hypothetical protein
MVKSWEWLERATVENRSHPTYHVRKTDTSGVSDTLKHRQGAHPVESSNRIITLFEILSEPAQTESSGFALPERVYEQQQQKKQDALRELARLQSNPAIWQMFARINFEMPVGGGSRDEVLRKAGEFAAILLPAFRHAQVDKQRQTNHSRFLREASKFDPFLEGGTSLTRDSFAGLGDVEPDTWADGLNLERRR